MERVDCLVFEASVRLLPEASHESSKNGTMQPHATSGRDSGVYVKSFLFMIQVIIQNFMSERSDEVAIHATMEGYEGEDTTYQISMAI